MRPKSHLVPAQPRTFPSWAMMIRAFTRIVNGHPNDRLDELLRWVYPMATVLRDVD
jgi:hypothetical protein